ncbi:MAG: hypothetical protein DRJ37_04240 [Thermoprotei archaeon]|nr:MAG: hypothetical protein DRJ37_04240 [Thermoprotei archaeon]
MRNKKFVKKVKRKIPWIAHIIEDVGIASELDVGRLKIKVSRKSPCIYCRGTKHLCGKPKCPVLLKFNAYARNRGIVNSLELVGSSPPAVFVGRIGYPYVYAGPLIPPEIGDTSIYDTPELWLNMSIEEIVNFRFRLVRSKFKVNVKKPEKAGKVFDETVEAVLSRTPVETEAIFRKKPGKTILLDDAVQPMGPSAPLEKLRVSGVRSDRRLEKAYYDYDLKAGEAVLELYERKVPVSKIQRAFSMGLFGLKNRRRLVPTRWSITAVDSIISKTLRDEIVKRNPVINEYRVYESTELGNRFIVLMFPYPWSYELIEAWFPGTAWNPDKRNIALCGDWEPYYGRTSYASIGGCYYAARLAVTEHLARERRQASVLILRESYPSYLLPLGVWQVRENVRNALRNSPRKFNTLKEALEYISSRLRINLRFWIESSKLLRDELVQEKLTKYMS